MADLKIRFSKVEKIMNISHDTSLRVTLIGILVLLISSANGEPPMPVAEVNYDSEFKFTRMIYSSSKQGLYGYGYRGRGGWRADWPEAEYHFLEGLSRLTRVNASAEGHYLKLLDADLFDFPWLYVLEAGSWVLSNEEITPIT